MGVNTLLYRTSRLSSPPVSPLVPRQLPLRAASVDPQSWRPVLPFRRDLRCHRAPRWCDYVPWVRGAMDVVFVPCAPQRMRPFPNISAGPGLRKQVIPLNR